MPRGLWGAGCLALVMVFVLALGADKKSASKSSREAAKEYNAAVALLNSNQIDNGIAKLEGLVVVYPGDPVTDKAKALLVDFGVGKEARVVLQDRKVFRDKLQILDKDVLALVEKAIKELEAKYKSVTPFFKERRLKVIFYDSEASYRKAGGLANATGHFSMADADVKKRALQGKVEWYLPKYAATLKDRQLSMKSILYHEVTHYLNAESFAGVLPALFEEGMATYFQSRSSPDYYQYYRQTERERIEASARNGLNAITKLDDFLSLLEGTRGFGQGGEMITRWYGLCYAVVDFFQEGQLGEKKASFDDFLEKLEALAAAAAKKARPEELPPRLNGKEALEQIVAEIYGRNLEDFHKALVQHVLKKYKQM